MIKNYLRTCLLFMFILCFSYLNAENYFLIVFQKDGAQTSFALSDKPIIDCSLGQFSVSSDIIINATALPYSEGVDLSTQGMANCYIVSESGTYKFPIDGYSGSSAFLLWNELGANDISDVELKGNYIFFKKNSLKKAML